MNNRRWEWRKKNRRKE